MQKFKLGLTKVFADPFSKTVKWHSLLPSPAHVDPEHNVKPRYNRVDSCKPLMTPKFLRKLKDGPLLQPSNDGNSRPERERSALRCGREAKAGAAVHEVATSTKRGSRLKRRPK